MHETLLATLLQSTIPVRPVDVGGANAFPLGTHPARGSELPTYIDIHDIPGVKESDAAGAHEADLRVQGGYGVDYRHYWVDEENGKVFCLVDAPDRETATRVHREAHGLEAHTLYQVKQGA
jgi:hypothetical protein